ncbi:MAG: hypothetical protein Q7T70_19115 [Polaromonas sp.]|nr:hypothetical protein [Polaromonas sp.]
MNKIFLFLLVCTLGSAVGAQPAADAVAAAVERERERINTERIALEARFDAEEAACHKRFAVNACLKDVQPRRREAMAQLRLQEVALNDQVRKQKAAEQLRKTEEKSSPEAQREAADRRARALEETRERQQRTQQKSEDRAILKQDEAANAASAASKLKGSQERAQARVDKKAAAAEEVEKYNDKQQEVQERKASREKKLREQTKPPAKPLPTPQ